MAQHETRSATAGDAGIRDNRVIHTRRAQFAQRTFGEIASGLRLSGVSPERGGGGAPVLGRVREDGSCSMICEIRSSIGSIWSAACSAGVAWRAPFCALFDFDLLRDFESCGLL